MSHNLTMTVPIRVKVKGEGYTGTVEGVGLLVYAQTLGEVVGRTIDAFDHLLDTVRAQGLDVREYLDVHNLQYTLEPEPQPREDEFTHFVEYVNRGFPATLVDDTPRVARPSSKPVVQMLRGALRARPAKRRRASVPQ